MSSGESIVKSEPRSVARVEQRSFVRPPCDVYESAEEFLLVTDLPGVSREDLVIQVEQSELIVEAHQSSPMLQGKVLSNELAPSEYRRRFALPAAVEAERVEAELRDGVLCVHLPKSEAAKPRQIPVH